MTVYRINNKVSERQEDFNTTPDSIYSSKNKANLINTHQPM